MLGVSSQFHEIVVFRLYKNLANKMLQASGIEFNPEEFQSMETELIKEFTNIISGNAVSSLKNVRLTLTPPLFRNYKRPLRSRRFFFLQADFNIYAVTFTNLSIKTCPSSIY